MADKGDINPATGKAYAVNPATGQWDDNYWANTVEPQLKGLSGGGGGNIDYGAIAREQMKMMQEANAPAVASLQASIPETQAKYAADRERLQAKETPLTERYNNLLSQVSQQGQQLTSRQQTETSREFGRRGISLQSGIFDQTLNEKLRPISEWITGQTKDVGFEREEKLAQLRDLLSQTSQSEVEQVRAIQNAIAQLQAGGAQNGITNALSLYQLQQNQALKEKELALAEAAANAKVSVNPLEQALAMAKLENMQANTARLNRTGSSSGGGGGDILSDIQTMFSQYGI